MLFNEMLKILQESGSPSSVTFGYVHHVFIFSLSGINCSRQSAGIYQGFFAHYYDFRGMT